MQLPKAVIFDLDGTLAQSFTPPEDAMIERLQKLSRLVPISIMSAATFERIQNDVLSGFSRHSDAISPLIFSLNGAQCWVHKDGQWLLQYDFAFSAEDTRAIEAALGKVAGEQPAALGGIKPSGTQIIDYKGYVAFTALGINASAEDKAAWDPGGSRRKTLKSMIERELPQYDVFIGGRTTIDIIPKGKNKKFGVEWLAEYLAVDPATMLFIGDGLYEGGNDAVVIPTGVRTISVADPSETAKIIDELLAK